jgi:hypothetical protein
VAKTYPAIGPFAPGDILTAATMTDIDTNLENQRVPTMASVYRSAALSHTSNGFYQSIAWDTQAFTQTDTGMWSAGTNPSRVTLTTAGLYVVTATVSPGASATGFRIPSIYKNGAAAAYGDTTPGNATINYCNVSALIQSDGDDYVEIFVFQNSGGNIAYTVGAATMQCSVAWLGQVS